jgi:hypothetical protein
MARTSTASAGGAATLSLLCPVVCSEASNKRPRKCDVGETQKRKCAKTNTQEKIDSKQANARKPKKVSFRDPHVRRQVEEGLQ